jgi:PTH1 family peptidyl-tRNA hydrolase
LVGLGNPGTRYQATRHNLGAEVIEFLAAQQRISLKKSHELFFLGTGQIDHHSVTLAIPRLYMNESGIAVTALLAHTAIAPGAMVLVHDEMDLSLGTLRLRWGGRDGGHRGVRSVIKEIGTEQFGRLKLGIGHPATVGGSVDHVLDVMPDADRPVVDAMKQQAVDALRCLVVEGYETAMNRYNRRAAG